MKFVAILIFIFSFLVAKELNIYLMNPENPKGFKLYVPIFNKNMGKDSVIIDSRDGKVFYHGKLKNAERKLKKFFKAKKLKSWDIPYSFKSIYNTILPNSYSAINLYMINSIFYKDKDINFLNGTPSDAFLTSNNSSFKYIDNFKDFPIKTYILTHKKYFLNNEHEKGLKRFYTLFCQKHHLNLQTFNSTFNTKKEKLQTFTINNKQKELKTYTKPPKKIHFDKDSIDITHNANKGALEGYIKNKQRANSTVSVYLNGEEHKIDCNSEGYCPFHLELQLGENIFKFIQIDNKPYIKKFNSKYIPDDKIKVVSEVTNNGDFLILKSIHTDRPKGSEVILKYKELNKEYKTKVDDDGYFEFRIPLKYAKNHFIFYEYNGKEVEIPIESKTIIKKEIEEAKKKREEARKKRLEELRKAKLKEVESINNNKKFKGQNGDPRVNLSWNDSNDIDLHVIDPCGGKISLGGSHICHGYLGKSDVDANVGKVVANPQENITWPKGGAKGVYTIRVHLYTVRDGNYVSNFTLTFVNNGKTYQRKGTVSKGRDFVISFTH